LHQRKRTAKRVAQRIDLQYFQRPHPLRRMRFRLALGATIVAVVWVGWLGARGEEGIYSAGPVSSPHAVFGAACITCHVGEGAYFKRVSDQACLDCHDGPQHNPRETFTPTCSSCHIEHTGAPRMAEVRDTACTQCHAALSVTSGQIEVDGTISDFVSGHPEFAALRDRRPDPGAIKLNHEVHMKAGLRAPTGNVTLECGDCHRPAGVPEAWPYGEAQFRTVAAASRREVMPVSTGRMEPVTYARSCASCHLLEFDKRFTASVPHDKPEVVRAFLERSFRDYLARNPDAWRKVEEPERRLPGRPMVTEPPARSPEEWLRRRVAASERLLWGKTCLECHALTRPAPLATQNERALPEITPVSQTAQWLPRARFHHEPHRMMACTSCHAAATSRETADVLMPGIATCQQCHHPGPQSAESRCFECHAYHDWTQKTRTKGKYQIEELLRRRSAATR